MFIIGPSQDSILSKLPIPSWLEYPSSTSLFTEAGFMVLHLGPSYSGIRSCMYIRKWQKIQIQ